MRHQVTEGALAFAREKQLPHPVCEAYPEVLVPGLSGDCLGAICSIPPEETLRVRNLGIPILNVSNTRGPVEGMGNFLSDDVAVGELAARHLREQGYRHFLCLAPEKGGLVHKERARGFELALAGTTGAKQIRIPALEKNPGRPWTRLRFVEEFAEHLRPKLQNLEPDTGIFATNDWMAWVLLNVLRKHQPELLHTVGVLGVDNASEDVWYGSNLPTLSSILPGFRQMGYEGMAWLAPQTDPNGTPNGGDVLKKFPPAGIAARASTAGGGCRDPSTSRMARWIWEQLRMQSPVDVDELAVQFHMSRKTVYRMFSKHLDMAPGDWIDGARLDLAKHLLRNTRLSIGEISEKCGFAKQDVLSRCLKRETGFTPREYRAGNSLLQNETPWDTASRNAYRILKK
ncbi:MAG: helix-turn-helix domain-containing protein [Kiritimatiellae bacterium]|nr:helix-turn-helix domain-containing protein [Kiritimatiellia bacterium]